MDDVRVSWVGPTTDPVPGRASSTRRPETIYFPLWSSDTREFGRGGGVDRGGAPFFQVGKSTSTGYGTSTETVGEKGVWGTVGVVVWGSELGGCVGLASWRREEVPVVGNDKGRPVAMWTTRETDLEDHGTGPPWASPGRDSVRHVQWTRGGG